LLNGLIRMEFDVRQVLKAFEVSAPFPAVLAGQLTEAPIRARGVSRAAKDLKISRAPEYMPRVTPASVCDDLARRRPSDFVEPRLLGARAARRNDLHRVALRPELFSDAHDERARLGDKQRDPVEFCHDNHRSNVRPNEIQTIGGTGGAGGAAGGAT